MSNTQAFAHQIKNLLSAFPRVADVFDDRWVEQELEVLPTRGAHPLMRWLLARDWTGKQKPLLETLSTVLEVLSHGSIGSLRARLNLLRGKPTGTWQDNYRNWWSTLCELLLAAHLELSGYRVQLGKEGADLRLLADNGQPWCQIEVTAPWQGVSVEELEQRLWWLSRSHEDLSIRLYSPADDPGLAASEIDRLVAETAAACSRVCQGRSAPPIVFRRERLLTIEVKPDGPRGFAPIRGGFAPDFSSLFPGIIIRTKRKVSKGQLTLDVPSILALELKNYQPFVSFDWYTRQGTALVVEFPSEDLPPEVTGVLIYAAILTDVRPYNGEFIWNPRSPWRQDPSVKKLAVALVAGPRST